MLQESNYSVLVSNVINVNNYSHCRLCLKTIEGSFIKFQDSVSLDADQQVFQPLHEILETLIGPEISDEIPGIDAVCPDCGEKALEALKFIEQCKNSTKLLINIFDNVAETLSTDIEINDKMEKMYIIVDKENPKIILFEKVEPKESLKDKSRRISFLCQPCNVTFADVEELASHMSSSHCKVMCSTCHQPFLDQTELELHAKNCDKYKHLDTGHKTRIKVQKINEDHAHTTFICKVCGKSFKGLSRLNAHEFEQHGGKNVCPKCGKTYITTTSYKKHVKLCFDNQIEPHPFRGKIPKSYCCAECGKGYSTPGGLRVHERFVHGNAQPYICEHCGKKFTAPSYLKTHLVTHTGEKKFKCKICQHNFVSKEALLYHTRRHTGEKPYACKLCDERFVNASSRAEHIKFKHNGPKLPCNICKRNFYTSSFLRQHMSRHNDPSSKLYVGRYLIPPNVPGKPNMRVKEESADSNVEQDEEESCKLYVQDGNCSGSG